MKRLGIVSLAAAIFTMPGLSARRPDPVQQLPAAIETIGAVSANFSGSAESGAAARINPRESLLPAGFSKSVTVVAGVLFLLPFAASSFVVLRRNRPL